jgi:serine/threonine protein phosphatase PrpC
VGNHFVLAVADGLGGHRAGEVASRRAVEILRACVQETSVRTPKEQGSFLRAAFHRAHETLHQEAQEGREGMGTTLVAASILEKDAVIANTGDSRAYLIREGVIFRSRDHSVVQQMVEKGTITEEEARIHPLKNLVTAALGLTLEIDLYSLSLEKGDTILLASDGFVEAVTEDRMAELVKLGSPDHLVEILLREALGQATDNVTIVLYHAP